MSIKKIKCLSHGKGYTIMANSMYNLDMALAKALPTAKTYECFADCRRQNQTGKIGKNLWN